MLSAARALGRLAGQPACLEGLACSQQAISELAKPLVCQPGPLQRWLHGSSTTHADAPGTAGSAPSSSSSPHSTTSECSSGASSSSSADGQPVAEAGNTTATTGYSDTSSSSRQQEYQQHPKGSTVNRREAEKFAALAADWWDPRGPFAPLHAMNPVRCRFLRTALCQAFGRDASQPRPLAGLRLLDVGCGGGLLAESLARMGAHVTGIDVNEAGIATAAAHAAQDADLAGRLQYRTASVEQLVAAGESYDAVVASEVIEHVDSLPAFCSALAKLTRPGGGVAVSTISRTPRSYALAIVAAEYLLRWVPPGTHDWTRFLTPEELTMQMEESTGGALTLSLLAGMELNPITQAWSLGRDTAVNYIAFFSKAAEGQGDAAGGAAGRG